MVINKSVTKNILSAMYLVNGLYNIAKLVM
jgi:hypothetical protein